MFLNPTIVFHGTSGCLFLISSGSCRRSFPYFFDIAFHGIDKLLLSYKFLIRKPRQCNALLSPLLQASRRDTAPGNGHSCVLYLGKDCIADERVQGAFYDEIDLVVEAGFKVIREIDQFPSDGPPEFNDNIDVALGSCLAPGIRPKDAYRGDAVFLPDLPAGIPGERPVCPGSMS